MDRCAEALPSFPCPHPDARDLGLNPKKFGSLANTKKEPSKLPLPEYTEELYIKHFKKNRPENVRSIEQMVKDYRKKKQERKMRRIEEKI